MLLVLSVLAWATSALERACDFDWRHARARHARASSEKHFRAREWISRGGGQRGVGIHLHDWQPPGCDTWRNHERGVSSERLVGAHQGRTENDFCCAPFPRLLRRTQRRSVRDGYVARSIGAMASRGMDDGSPRPDDAVLWRADSRIATVCASACSNSAGPLVL